MLATESIEKEVYDNYVENAKKSTNFIMILIIVLAILFVIGGIFSTIFALFNMPNTKIINGVLVRGIEVSGLTQEEAKEKLAGILGSELNNDIILEYKEFTTNIKPEQLEFQYNIDNAILSAYQVGREGNIIENNYKIVSTMFGKEDVPLVYEYNSGLANQIIAEIEPKLPGVVEQPSF